MAKAMSVALLLSSSKKLKQKFIRHVRPKSDGNSGSASMNLVTEVMAYVMGARSESNRKIAWKRGRVIEFLHGEGVKIEKIAAEIQSRGGIEAILKHAAKQKPRRDKDTAGTKTKMKKSAAVTGTTSDKSSDRDTPDRDDSDVITARIPGTSRQNDGLILLPMLIKLSDRDMLEELPAESRVRIVATRINQKGATIEVNRIKKLKPAVQKLDDHDDDDLWD